MNTSIYGSETLAVDDARSVLVVLALGDPHGGEGGETAEHTASDPDGVLPLGGTHHLDLDVATLDVEYVLGESLSQTREHGAAAGEDEVIVKVFTDILVALHDTVVAQFVDAHDVGLGRLQQARVEQGFGTLETLLADGDRLSVRQLVGLVHLGRLAVGLELLGVVQSHVAQFLFDVVGHVGGVTNSNMR